MISVWGRIVAVSCGMIVSASINAAFGENEEPGVYLSHSQGYMWIEDKKRRAITKGRRSVRSLGLAAGYEFRDWLALEFSRSESYHFRSRTDNVYKATVGYSVVKAIFGYRLNRQTSATLKFGYGNASYSILHDEPPKVGNVLEVNANWSGSAYFFGLGARYKLNKKWDFDLNLERARANVGFHSILASGERTELDMTNLSLTAAYSDFMDPASGRRILGGLAGAVVGYTVALQLLPRMPSCDLACDTSQWTGQVVAQMVGLLPGAALGAYLVPVPGEKRVEVAYFF